MRCFFSGVQIKLPREQDGHPVIRDQGKVPSAIPTCNRKCKNRTKFIRKDSRHACPRRTDRPEPHHHHPLYLATVFQHPSLQLTEDQSETARGLGHLSRSPAPSLQLGPLLPAPQPLGPAPALPSPTSGSPTNLPCSDLASSPPTNPPLSLFAFIYFGLASCPPRTRSALSGLPHSLPAAPFRTPPRKAFVSE